MGKRIIISLLLFFSFLFPSFLNGFAQNPEEIQFEGQIAYIGADGNLWVLRQGISEPIQVTFRANEGNKYLSPRWSPDGSILAYCQKPAGEGEIGRLYFARAGIWQSFLLIEDVLCQESPEGSLDWSPDGTQIIYARPGSTNSGQEQSQGIWGVHIVTGETSEVVISPTGNPLLHPEWSPDGKWLQFYEVAYIEGLGVFRTWEQDSGSFYTWLGIQGVIFPGSSSWSPDSLQIVFDEVTYAGFPGAGLYTASPRGENVNKIFSRGRQVAMQPIWSPDGLQITFLASVYDTPTMKLMLLSPNGGEPYEIYSSESSLAPLVWSPDGSQLLFAAQEGEQINLYIYQIGGEVITQIGVAGAWQADWSLIPPESDMPTQARSNIITDFPFQEGLVIYLAPDYRLVLYNPSAAKEISLTDSMEVAAFYPSPSRKNLIYNQKMLILDFTEDGQIRIQESALPAAPDAAKIRWSADESRVAYQDKAEKVWIVDLGGNYVEVPEAIDAPAWSADGSWLSYCTAQSELWIIGPDKPPERLARDVFCDPIWSPGHNWLAYTQKGAEGSDHGKVIWYDAENDTKSVLIDDSRVEAWSGDGDLLAVRQEKPRGNPESEYAILAVDPQNSEQLFIGYFDKERPGLRSWQPINDGYLFGPYHLKSDLSSVGQIADSVYAASSDGRVLLVGIGEGQQIILACVDTSSGERRDIQTIYQATLRSNERPGIWSTLTANGEWTAYVAYDRRGVLNQVMMCEGERQLSLDGNRTTRVGTFSADNRWYIQPVKGTEGEENLILNDLLSEKADTLPIMKGSSTYWLQPYPVEPIQPEIELYTVSGRVTMENGDPMEGIPILLDGTQITKTDASGNFVINEVGPGKYTLYPEQEEIFFDPESQTISLPPDLSGIDFVSISATEAQPTEVSGVNEIEEGGAFPIIPGDSAWPVEPEIALAALCGGAALILALLVSGVYFVSRKRQGVESSERYRDPNAVLPEPAQTELQAMLREGVAHMKKGEYDQGMTQLRQVIEYNPQNAGAWMWLGWGASQRGDQRAAEVCFRQAKELNHPKAAKALAWLEKQEGNTT